MDLNDLIWELELLKDKLYVLGLKRTKKVFLTSKEIRELMKTSESIPTNIFNAEKRDYIVKPRTIHGPKLVKTRKIK